MSYNEGDLVDRQMTVNTFTINQCVLNDMKIYITFPFGTRKCCKYFQMGTAKMDQSEHIIRYGSFNTKQSYMVIKAAPKQT